MTERTHHRVPYFRIDEPEMSETFLPAYQQVRDELARRQPGASINTINGQIALEGLVPLFHRLFPQPKKVAA